MDVDTAIISASLGGMDKPSLNVPQSLSHDYFLFTDKNFPPRITLAPRLQAKIPKMFGWQMAPNYDYYLWLDGNLRLNHPLALQYFYDQLQGYDIVTLKHPRRDTVKWEARYLERALNEQSKYMVSRYAGELFYEQMAEINADKDFVDDLLVIGGIFMYRNTQKVRKMLKEWWYHVSRYIVQDQISFSYVLKKSELNIKVLEHTYNEWEYLRHENHKKRYV